MAKKKTRRDLYQEITDRIVQLLEQGTVPWRNPIRRGQGDGWPKNLDTQKRYRGINVFLLATMTWAHGYDSDYWVTFRQARSLGGSIRKGEKASLVVFWKQYDTKDRDTGEEITVPVLKHYNVFNLEQCDGIENKSDMPPLPNDAPFEPLEAAEAIVAGYNDAPQVRHGGSRAFYRPSADAVFMPHPERFNDRESYYSTLFHELSHSTGHSRRLDRGLDTQLAPFGSPDYSKEELVSEMSAAFLAAAAGISPPTIEQSAAYIAGWKRKLKDDKRLVVTAAAAAQKATDWILGETFQATEDQQETPSQPMSRPTINDNAPETPPTKQLDLF